MKDYGLVRAVAAVPVVKVADVQYNKAKILKMTDEAVSKGASLVVFPELCLTGYTCADLFGMRALVDAAEKAVGEIMEYSRGKDICIVVGTPVRFLNRLYNCAAIIRNGNIKGLVPKTYIPDYGEFQESRWFSSGRDFLDSRNGGGPLLSNGKDCVRQGFNAEITYAGFRCNISPNLLFDLGKLTFAVEICEDLWSPVPPSSWHALSGASLILNLSASNEVLGKNAFRRELIRSQSAKTISGYIYCSSGYGESTQDLVFSGAAFICENGTVLAENKLFNTDDSMIVADIDYEKIETTRQKTNTFNAVSPDGQDAGAYRRLYSRVPAGKLASTDFESTLYRHIEPLPFIPGGSEEESAEACNGIIAIQVAGLMKRLSHINCNSAVIGISGGLDSTLALIVTVLAFDRLGWKRERIIGVTMPGYGTTDRTYTNAVSLMKTLGVTIREISITAACDRHFEDIGHDKSVHDVTYENSQARERTQILMDIANQTSGIVIGTGDLSELALGWATYNGDHMSMYGVNAGIPKTLVKHLVRRAAYDIPEAKEILLDIIDTPISPELLPADAKGGIKQKTEDLVGPYELHDFFLYNFVRFGYSKEKILFLAENAFSKEGCNPYYSKETVARWLDTFIRRFFNQQFKRSCMPDGPKIGTVGLSPRGDWRMPPDASSELFR